MKENMRTGEDMNHPIKLNNEYTPKEFETMENVLTLIIKRAEIGYVHDAPERTARRSGPSFGSDTQFQVWSNRAAMARSIRMQERGPFSWRSWRAVVPLTETEGY